MPHRTMTGFGPAIALALVWTVTAADDGHDVHHGASDPHLRLTAGRAATPGDRARYRAIEDTIRHQLARYRCVERAVADGYQPLHPGLGQDEVHYTKRAHALRAMLTFDPASPTSLLYRRDDDGAYMLTGVMYTAPHWFGEAALDERVPLSMAPWHQHVDLCLPGRSERWRWRETRDGQPLFGPKSPIATAAECENVGGRFVERLFGWMVHVGASWDGWGTSACSPR